MAGLVPININIVNAGNSPLFPGNPQGGMAQGSDGNDFMSVLSAIFAGLNGSMMGMTAQNSDGKQFNLEALLQGLKVESNGETVSGQDALDMLNNFMLNANAPQIVMAAFDGKQSQGISDSAYTQASAQAVVQMAKQNPVQTANQMANIPLSGEANAQSQPASLEGNNAFMQLKMMMNSETETKLSSGNQSSNNAIVNIVNPENLKTADSNDVVLKLQKGYSDFGSAVKEAATSMADSIKAEAAKPLFTGLADAESELMSQETQKNPVSAAVVSIERPAEAQNAAPKETVHITKIGELGEPIMKTIGAGEKYLIIKLDPPDMGTVQIKLTLENGVLKADFKVESQAVKEMFSTAMPQIKAALEDAGIKSNNFFVNVRDELQQQDGGEKKQQGQDADGRQQPRNNNHKEPKQKFNDFFA